MSSAAHAVAAPPQRAAAARRGPARSAAQVMLAGLFLAITTLLFTVSSGLLWNLGINYSGLTGAIASKIHPATYLASFTFALLILARRNPASFFVGLVTRHSGTLAFLLATLLLAAYILLDGRKGIATIVDTYLLAVMVALIAAALDPRDIGRVEKLIHVLLACNAGLALIEYLIDYRLFPFRFEGLAFEWDKRSSALLGHPLENAQVTGIYIMILLASGGPAMPKLLRPAAILLQLAAMIPFGGRTALTVTLALMTLWMIPRVLHVLRGGRLPLPAFAAIAVLAPMLMLAVGLFSVGGFFDVMLNRFEDDGGSAKSRLAMFEVFGHLSLGDIIMGANPELIDAIRRTMGLEWGIENPVVRLLLYQGVIFTGFMVAGFVLFMVEIARRLRPGYGLPMAFFLVVINSYESVANKTMGLALFIVLMLAMFPKAELTAQESSLGA
jgi:hypothetical protein